MNETMRNYRQAMQATERGTESSTAVSRPAGQASRPLPPGSAGRRRAAWRTFVGAPLLALALAACAPLPVTMGPGEDAGLRIRDEASPNFDARRPNLVILHHTSDNTLDEALGTLTNPERKVSAHYLIGRDGEIVRLVDEAQRAWHAGLSWWGGQTDLNSASIGIELDNDGFEPFADKQIDALLALLADIRTRHRLPRANFIGHADVAPGRKVDPSAWFPWRRLAEQGFGLWCELPQPPAPFGFDLDLALTALGYSPYVPEASRHAFLLHYAGERESVTEDEAKSLAQCLLQQRAESMP